MAESAFAARVRAWAEQTKEDNRLIFREAVQRTIAEMQTPVAAGGDMPVDTGFLRASMVVGVSPASATRANPGTMNVAYDTSQMISYLLGIDVGKPVYVSWTANYARHVHYGANGRPGRQWITLAAQRWPQIVAKVASEVRSAGRGAPGDTI